MSGSELTKVSPEADISVVVGIAVSGRSSRACARDTICEMMPVARKSLYMAYTDMIGEDRND